MRTGIKVCIHMYKCSDVDVCICIYENTHMHMVMCIHRICILHHLLVQYGCAGYGPKTLFGLIMGRLVVKWAFVAKWFVFPSLACSCLLPDPALRTLVPPLVPPFAPSLSVCFAGQHFFLESLWEMLPNSHPYGRPRIIIDR